MENENAQPGDAARNHMIDLAGAFGNDSSQKLAQLPRAGVGGDKNPHNIVLNAHTVKVMANLLSGYMDLLYRAETPLETDYDDMINAELADAGEIRDILLKELGVNYMMIKIDAKRQISDSTPNVG